MSDFEKQDQELAEMMGQQFIDQTVPLSEMPRTNEESSDISKPKKTAEKPVDAQWMPTKQRNWMDDLYDCMKTTMLFGGLNVLIWYWESAGLMDESIALPSMIACAVLAGIGIGKVLGGKR